MNLLQCYLAGLLATGLTFAALWGGFYMVLALGLLLARH